MRWASEGGVDLSLAPPTRVRDWRLVARTTRLVLSIPAYAGLAVGAGIGSLSVFVLSRNLDLLAAVVLFGDLPIVDRLQVLVGLYPGVGNAYALDASVLLVATAALVGVDIALVGYHLREHRLSAREGSGGLAGVVLGPSGQAVPPAGRPCSPGSCHSSGPGAP